MNCSSNIVAYPAGKCPVKLLSSDYDSVIEWAEEILSHGRNKNIIYLPSAIMFFVQQFYSIFTPEYKEVRRHLISRYIDVTFYDEEIKRFQGLPPPTKNTEIIDSKKEEIKKVLVKEKPIVEEEKLVKKEKPKLRLKRKN